jgi:hypothetical protein
MNEYNIKITYLKAGRLNLRKTLISYAKYYIKYCAKLMLNNIRKAIYEKLYEGSN